MSNSENQQFSNWAKRLSESDEKALEELFDNTFERFVQYALQFVKTKDLAIDVVQNSFISIWENRMRLKASKSFKSYLYRTVKNKSLNAIRDSGPHMRQLDDVVIADEDHTLDFEDDGDELLKSYLKNWIQDLPSRQSEAFKLSRYEGLSHDEIAGVMDISERTVNNHIVKALNTLKERYKDFKKEKKQHYE